MPKPDVQAERDQDNAEQEGNAPAPRKEVLARHRAQREDRQIREKQASRYAELRPGSDESAMAIRLCPLHREKHRAAPFAADADTLNEAQERQDDRAPNTDVVIAGDERDQKGGDCPSAAAS